MNAGIVLVVAGTDYIGTHMVKSVRETGQQVGVLDNLSVSCTNCITTRHSSSASAPIMRPQ